MSTGHRSSRAGANEDQPKRAQLGGPRAWQFIVPAVVLAILSATAVVSAPAAPPPPVPAAPAASGGPSGKVVAGSLSGSLRQLPPATRGHGPSTAGLGHRGQTATPVNTAPDALGASAPAPAGPGALSGTIANFEGISNINGVFPPDTNGDVGPSDYIQLVNSSFQVFDKQGNSLAGPFNTNTLWATLPANSYCRTTNDGDGIVRHDALADRWIINQFAFPQDSSGNPIAPYHECFAVSKTSDPVNGGWYLYDFQVSNQKFNDYPKMGIWPDGYYMTFNWDGEGGPGGIFAFDRSDMLNGNPAGFICFGCDTGEGLNNGDNFSNLSSEDQLLPGDLDGSNLPAAGAPETIMRFTGTNTLRSWAVHADWQVPANSTITPLPDITVANFNSSLSGIPQPGVTQTLDPLSDRLMYRLQYRNFGSYESLVVNHTVNVDGAGHAGIRFYELRRSGANWSLFQQGTFAPDSSDRWMGSIAMDKAGDMALGYSVVNSSSLVTQTVYPSIRVTGRLSSDPLGLLPQGELTIKAGTGTQNGADKIGRGRWGDYSSMMLDPTDDCTFWYTQEYIQTTANFNWQTRVGSFRFPSCDPADVSITKSASQSPAVAGGELDWNLTVKNNGPSVAHNVLVTDTLTAGDSPFAVATPPACSITGQTVACQLGTLANGASVPIQIRSQVAANYDVAGGGPTSLTNSATTSADELDPNTGNNTASASVVVNERADLAVSKACDANVLAGQSGACTIYVDNNGPSVSRNVVLTDASTSNGTFTLTSATPSQGSCGALPPANQNNASITCALGNLGPATTSGPGRATVVVSYTATEGQSINDQATATSDTSDPNSANNTQNATLPVTALADLQITGDSTAPAAVNAGQNLTFSVTVTNAGPSTAQSVVVTDALPASVTVTAITLPGGTSCNAGVPGDPFHPATCGLDLLGPGASAVLTIATRVNPRATGTLHSDAQVTSATLDSNNSNNFAHTDTVVTPVADLAVTLSGSPNPVVAGTPLTYVATLSNAGPSTARTVTLLENLDTNVTFQSASISNGGIGTCALVTSNPHQVQCQLNDIDPPTQGISVYTQVQVNSSAPDGGTLSTAVQVSTSSNDPNSSNNSATAMTGVQRQADLNAALTAPSHNYHPSTNLTFTGTITNNGPSDAQTAVLTIKLPGTKVGNYVSDTGGAACTHSANITNLTVVCTYPTLAAGGVRSVQVVFFFQGNQKLQTGTDQVGSATADPVAANNSATWSVSPK